MRGDRINGIYLCKQKQSAVTKNGKPYENIILQDKTGIMDGKIWDPNSLGIDDFDALDYIDVVGDVTSFAERDGNGVGKGLPPMTARFRKRQTGK